MLLIYVLWNFCNVVVYDKSGEFDSDLLMITVMSLRKYITLFLMLICYPEM